MLLLTPFTFILGFILSFVIGWKVAVWIFLGGVIYYISFESLSKTLGDVGQCIFMMFTPVYVLLNMSFQNEKPSGYDWAGMIILLAARLAPEVFKKYRE